MPVDETRAHREGPGIRAAGSDRNALRADCGDACYKLIAAVVELE